MGPLVHPLIEVVFVLQCLAVPSKLNIQVNLSILVKSTLETELTTKIESSINSKTDEKDNRFYSHEN